MSQPKMKGWEVSPANDPGGMDAAKRIKEDAIASILNHIAVLGASRHLGISRIVLMQAIQHLAARPDIDPASDDTAGLRILNKLRADTRLANQGKRNADDSIRYLQVADGALAEVIRQLTRAAELAEQARTDTISGSDRANFDAEFKKIILTINDIVEKTTFHGATVFTPATDSGSEGGFPAISLTIGTSRSTRFVLGLSATTHTLVTPDDAGAAGLAISSTIASASSSRVSLSVSMQQLATVSNRLGTQVENFTAACSQTRDATIAEEVVNLTKFQILNQSGASTLGRENQAAQQCLALLR